MPKATRKSARAEPGKGAGHVFQPGAQSSYSSPLSRAKLLDVHSTVARVSGSLVLSAKSGATQKELQTWAAELRSAAAMLVDPS